MECMEHNNRPEGEVFEQTNVVVSASRRDYFLPVSILVAGVVIAGAVVFATFYRGSSPAPVPSGQQAAGQQPTANVADIMKLGARDVVLGNADAPATIIEYGDYQCPYCTRFFSQTQPLLAANYINTGKAKLVFRDLIVNDRTAQDHESHNAALAAACSKDQGKFWQFHDALYQLEAKDEAANPQGSENNGNLNRAAFMNIAKTLGMDQNQFGSCYDSGKYTAQVQAESDQAAGYGISATPSFLVNGQPIVGAQPYATFQQAIEVAKK